MTKPPEEQIGDIFINAMAEDPELLTRMATSNMMTILNAVAASMMAGGPDMIKGGVDVAARVMYPQAFANDEWKARAQVAQQIAAIIEGATE